MNKPKLVTGYSSPVLTKSGSESDLINERRRKRLQSNRESARRSRMKKQKLIDDLTAQLTQLRKDNRHITTELSVVTEHYAATEAENAVMRAQLSELNHRLNSLNQLLRYAAGGFGMDYGGGGGEFYDGAINIGFYNQTANMASASTGVGDVFNCW